MIQGLKKLLQGDREPIGVVLAGGCGGFLAAIYGEVVNQPILDGCRGWVFSVLLGMGAGFVGVYLREVEKRKLTGTLFRPHSETVIILPFRDLDLLPMTRALSSSLQLPKPVPHL